MVHSKEDLSFSTNCCNFLSILKRKVCKFQNHKAILLITIIMLYLFGAFTHVFELNYDTDFNYPLKQNIVECVQALAAEKPLPHCNIINSYNYSFIINNEKKCIRSDNSSIRLVLIIKSAIDNFGRRLAIRNTWGYEERFYDVGVKRIFMLGATRNRTILQAISNEQEEFGDIVQADFFDTYYNNTIKTMMAFKWAVKYCDAKFYLFSDDDMYISVKNILRFIRNPTEYPQYLQRSNDKEVDKHLNKVTEYDLPEGVKLISGFVSFSSPHRHQCSKWYVSLDEYPYHKWPPYVSAGSYIVSREALKEMHYASYYTQHFRFDDIYIGLLAKKLGIEMFHCPEFYIFKKIYDKSSFKYVLSSHGYHSSELIKIWNEQKMMGNA
ncbi:beta-1,3-galactosyltransferase brn-like [Planococcus citri]|uniref:beta-1,3-galactosyltransferase brn-like n=1 Tax=Planococcus citri TaxID=170843 RepID=UPI0031F8A630